MVHANDRDPGLRLSSLALTNRWTELREERPVKGLRQVGPTLSRPRP